MVRRAWREAAKLPRELWILCLVIFVNRMGNMALPFLALYLTIHLGFSVAQAGTLLAVYGGAALLIGPVSGRLSDRWGPPRMIRSSLAMTGVILIAFPYVRSGAGIATMTILWAFAVESFRPANLTLIGQLGAQHGRAAFALGRFASNVGLSIGPAIGGFLAQVSFPALFVVDGVTSLGAAGIVLAAWFPAAISHHEVRHGLFDGFRRDKKFRVFLLSLIPAAMVFGQFSSSMSLFMVHDLQLPASAYGLLFTINTAIIILLEIPVNAGTAHWRHHKSLAFGAFLIAAGFGALAFAGSYAVVALTVVIWTFGEMLFFPAMSNYVSEMAPAGRKGEYMGLYMTSLNFSLRLAGPWIGVLAFEKFGSPWLWIGAFVIGMLSVLSFSSTRH
jgi:predicted MFS family arabinose efflux permease